jgi:hypothetical protein
MKIFTATLLFIICLPVFSYPQNDSRPHGLEKVEKSCSSYLMKSSTELKEISYQLDNLLFEIRAIQSGRLKNGQGDRSAFDKARCEEDTLLVLEIISMIAKYEALLSALSSHITKEDKITYFKQRQVSLEYAQTKTIAQMAVMEKFCNLIDDNKILQKHFEAKKLIQSALKLYKTKAAVLGNYVLSYQSNQKMQRGMAY